MKKILKKNQIIVTALAVLIAVAGYLNYTDNLSKKEKANEANGNTYDSIYSDDNLADENGEIKSQDEDHSDNVSADNGKNNSVGENAEGESQEETKEPGAAVLTNGTSVSSYMVQARLNREQTRSKNKETLLEVINNKELGESQKKKAVKSMTELTKTTELENTVETLLKAKGFEDVLVTITDKQADVIVNDAEMNETKQAQIENVVKRKTGIEAKNITITPTNNK